MTMITSDKVQQDKSKLASFEAAFSAAREDRESARKSVADALARIEACDELISSIEIEMLALRSTIDSDESRLQACRRQLASLPVELLRAIFQYISSSPDPLWTTLGDGEYSRERAMRPFHLAAVCKRWRQVARTSPELWTYLGIPVPSSTVQGLLQLHRINVIVKRSKQLPLDVLFHWPLPEDAIPDIDSHAQAIMRAVAQVVHRWRNFEFSAPKAAFIPDNIEMFRHPTPMLQRLSIHALSTTGTNDLFKSERDLRPVRYFPVAPLLEEFSSLGTNVQINAARHPQILGQLRSLEITIGPAATNWLWRGLAVLPRLRRLTLWTRQDDDENSTGLEFVQPSSEICIAELEQLNLDDDAALLLSRASPLLKFPLLKYLAVSSGAIDVLGPTLLVSSGSVITNVTIDCMFDDLALVAFDAETLHYVPSLLVLKLESVEVSAEFFDVLSQPRPDGTWLLGRLTTLELESCELVGDHDACGDSIVHVVRARTGVSTEVARLNLVSIDDGTNLKSWHREEISLLMGDDTGNKASPRSSASSPDFSQVLDTVHGAPSDEEEAALTDSGETDSNSSSLNEGQENVWDEGHSSEDDDYVESDGSSESG